MNKICTYIIAFVFFLSTYSVIVPAAEQSHIDAVLVIDTSNSMNGSDPQRISIEGAKLFIDMLEAQGSKVAVVGFSGEIVYETPFYSINSNSDKEEIKDGLNSIKFTGLTDIGLALNKADQLISTLPNDSNPLVIMFTDGKIETNRRTEQQSLDDVDKVLLSAKNNYPIYTIGLNETNRVDQELLERISDETNAKNYMTNNPADLPDIFNQIFGYHSNLSVLNIGTVTTDGRDYNLIDINIPNDNVSEANIVMLSSEKLLDTKLIDPSGKEVRFNRNNGIYYTHSNKYSMLKLINPTKGNWILKIKGVKGDQVKINLLYNYDVNLNSRIDGNISKGNKITVIGEFVKSDGTPYPNGVSSNVNGELIILDPNGTQIQKLPMINNGSNLSLDYDLPHAETAFAIKVHAAGDGFYRESNVIEIEIKNLPPNIVDEIEPVTILRLPVINNGISIDLTKHFKDDDDVELFYNITFENDKLSYEVNDDELIIKSNSSFQFIKSDAEIICEDASGTNVKIIFSVTSIPLGLLIIAIAVVIIIIIIVFTKILKKYIVNKNKPFMGELRYFIKDNGTMGVRKNTDLRLFKGTLNLDKVIELDGANMSDISKITISPGFVQGKDVLNVKNNSAYKIITNMEMGNDFQLDITKSMVVKNNDNVQLHIQFDKN